MQHAAEAAAKINSLTQKGNLVCKGGIRAVSFAVENEKNMNLQNLISETVKSSISHIEKVNTRSLSLETITSLSPNKVAVKVLRIFICNWKNLYFTISNSLIKHFKRSIR